MKKTKIIMVMLFFVTLWQTEPVFLLAQDFSEGEAITVNERNLSMMPCRYLNKKITTEAVFMDVSTTLLDDIYHDVDTRFDSREYLNFRTIGNGMYHYFIKQSKADIIPTLKPGDRIIISGKVTSCADRHAWIEVDSVTKVPEK
jgi:hypothetical protein